MKLTKRIFKYLIDRAVDRRQPLRGWAAWYVRRDWELRQYEKKMRAVDLLLRDDLDAHLSRPFLDSGCIQTADRVAAPFDKPSLKRTRRRLILAGSAAMIAAVLVLPALITVSSKPSPDTIAVNNRMPPITDPKSVVLETSPQTNESASLTVWDELRIHLHRDGRSVFDQIPRPLESLPAPDRDTICDSLSASNPICDYIIGCYVRPVFSNASPPFRHADDERNRM